MYKSFLIVLSFIFLLFFAQKSMAPGEAAHSKPAKNALPPLYPTKKQPKTTKPNQPQKKQRDTKQTIQTLVPANNAYYYLSSLYSSANHEALFHKTACLC